ncbi:MAG TPA: hypothetical protein GXX28_05585 [Firmicutes bacterium]|nr:hypothetical protein [Bacillota bacterium]
MDPKVIADLAALADKSLAAVVILVVAVVVVKLATPWMEARAKAASPPVCPQVGLVPLVENNTKAMTELTGAVDQLKELTREQSRILAEVRVDVARLKPMG